MDITLPANFITETMSPRKILTSITASLSLASCHLPTHDMFKTAVVHTQSSRSLESADFSSPEKGVALLYAKTPGHPTPEELQELYKLKVTVFKQDPKDGHGHGATIFNTKQPSTAHIYVEQHISEPAQYYAQLFGESLTPKIKAEIMKHNEITHLILHDSPNINFLNPKKFPNFQIEGISVEGQKFNNKIELSEFLSDVASVTYSRVDLIRILKNAVSLSGGVKNYAFSNNFLLSKLKVYFATQGQQEKSELLLKRLTEAQDPNEKSPHLYEMLDLIGRDGAHYLQNEYRKAGLDLMAQIRKQGLNR